MTETIIIDSRFGYTALYHEQEALNICMEVLHKDNRALNVCRTVLRRVQSGIERLQDGFASCTKGP